MEKVTLRVAEVEGIEVKGQLWEEVKIVKIQSIRKHPEADQLNLVTFQLQENSEQTKEVVCGAPNVRVGLKVPYACLGTKFPDGLVLTAKKIRGIVSEGMLCSKT